MAAISVEPIGEPGRVDPGAPDREQEQESLKGAVEGEVFEEVVGELGDCEDEDEVEEQLDEGNARPAVAALAEQSGHAEAVVHSLSPLAAFAGPASVV
ncbi:MAG: hypothetical protein QOF33_2134 [Thermomicrobiales bacterium]|jgi:hypothetical protein|nr:hypothetical protein [Thermomicrobiales bacterium]